LRKLAADYVRIASWFPYPHDPIAELYPHSNGTTSWDFTSIDPFVIDLHEATKSQQSG